jgi:hypothetical protein
MKAEIVVTFDGLLPTELKAALQGLRNIEQCNPERIEMFMLVTTPEIPTEQAMEMLKSITPPLTYFKTFTDSAIFTANRNVEEERPKR